MQLTGSNSGYGGSHRPSGERRPAPAEPHGFDKVLNGLMSVLDTEQTALSDASEADFAGLTRQKLQLLMQLDRLAAVHKAASLPPGVGDKLLATRRKLDENARMLRHRMEAIREIAELISEEIRDAQSDGTYSIAARGGR